MKVYVISGGPGVGKTTLLQELAKQGYKVLPESAREVRDSHPVFKTQNILEIDQTLFQPAVFHHHRKAIKEVDEEIIFCDRGFGDTFAYYSIHKLPVEEEIDREIRGMKYEKVFILDPLPDYVKDDLRKESREEALIVHETIVSAYEELGHDIIHIPAVPIEERVKIILNNL